MRLIARSEEVWTRVSVNMKGNETSIVTMSTNILYIPIISLGFYMYLFKTFFAACVPPEMAKGDAGRGMKLNFLGGRGRGRGVSKGFGFIF